MAEGAAREVPLAPRTRGRAMLGWVWALAPALVALLVALWARLPGLLDAGPFLDESDFAYIGRELAREPAVGWNWKTIGGSPGIYPPLSWWAFQREGLLGIRLLNVLLGCGMVLAGYATTLRLARRWFAAEGLAVQRGMALAAALLLAVAAGPVYTSRHATYDALACLLLALALLGLSAAPSSLPFALSPLPFALCILPSSVALGLAVTTRYSIIMALPGVFLFAAARALQEGKRPLASYLFPLAFLLLPFAFPGGVALVRERVANNVAMANAMGRVDWTGVVDRTMYYAAPLFVAGLLGALFLLILADGGGARASPPRAEPRDPPSAKPLGYKVQTPLKGAAGPDPQVQSQPASAGFVPCSGYPRSGRGTHRRWVAVEPVAPPVHTSTRPYLHTSTPPPLEVLALTAGALGPVAVHAWFGHGMGILKDVTMSALFLCPLAGIGCVAIAVEIARAVSRVGPALAGALLLAGFWIILPHGPARAREMEGTWADVRPVLAQIERDILPRLPEGSHLAADSWSNPLALALMVEGSGVSPESSTSTSTSTNSNSSSNSNSGPRSSGLSPESSTSTSTSSNSRAPTPWAASSNSSAPNPQSAIRNPQSIRVDIRAAWQPDALERMVERQRAAALIARLPLPTRTRRNAAQQRAYPARRGYRALGAWPNPPSPGSPIELWSRLPPPTGLPPQSKIGVPTPVGHPKSKIDSPPPQSKIENRKSKIDRLPRLLHVWRRLTGGVLRALRLPLNEDPANPARPLPPLYRARPE